ncbi:glycosyl transferase family 11 [Rhodococcus wratislaviensis]|uniref:Glycosyl transferase family 11 n=1 Tax=Rhodococcus wratislaviensis TaxID=44752 RepID=A0AB38FH85_RHOWR|nr:alpha-1,2-fucosyltransferase [Rhodococcus wratislaviensis]REE73008.1 glycosyl transferase family 11 [Rhodococcus wratislaviensis]SPZ40846.1 Glycosyl transferase family 11 [Rhodococcus wratislaviensis]
MTVTVEMRGGRANQMFGLAAGILVSKEFGSELILDHRLISRHGPKGFQISDITNGFKTVHLNDLEMRMWRKFRRLQPAVEVRVASRIMEARSSRGTVTLPEERWEDRRSYYSNPVLLRGYFQNAAPDIAADMDLISSIKSSIEEIPEVAQIGEVVRNLGIDRYIAVHVRRGDYVKVPRNLERLGVCSADYYISAVDALAVSLPVLIVSDDHAWCEENLVNRIPNSRVFNGGSAWSDMSVISGASAVVLSNSTFSWWGAVLGQSSGVIFPTPWFDDPSAGGDSLGLANWIGISKSKNAQ